MVLETWVKAELLPSVCEGLGHIPSTTTIKTVSECPAWVIHGQESSSHMYLSFYSTFTLFIVGPPTLCVYV